MANSRKKTRGVSTDRLLIKWIEETRKSLRQQHKELQQQARIAFVVFLVTFSIGLLLTLLAITFVFVSNLPPGIVAALSGIIISIFCGIPFNFYREVNNRLFRVSAEMSSLDKNNIAMQYIGRIADGKTKDRAIQDLSKSIYAKA
jgi:cation transport ATPase